MRDFFTSVACKSRAHCNTCRDRERGSVFRRNALGDEDKECPHGVPWGFKGRLVATRSITPTRFDIAKASIMSMHPDSENGKFLKAMLAQIQQLIREGRGGSCREKRAYRKRMQDKVVFLWREYGDSACVD